MAIIVFDKDELIDYVPAYGNNRESDDPCIVRLRFVPYSRVQHYARVRAAMSSDATDPEGRVQASQTVQRRQFVESVESISGYRVGDREVTDPGEFYDTAPAAMILEIIMAMEDAQRLTEGQRKNSGRASAGA